MFKGISNLPKPSLQKNSSGDIYSIAGGIRGVPIFLKNISQNVNIIARLEFELADFEAAVKHIN